MKSFLNKVSSDNFKQVNQLNIIFIDVDGVLNNANTSVTSFYCVESFLLEKLKKIIEKTNGTLVLSSSWRTFPVSRGALEEILEKNKVKYYISCTPNFRTNRVDEILAWIKDNTTYFDNNPTILEELNFSVNDTIFPEYLPLNLVKLNEKIKINNFIAIDDMDLMKEGTHTHYIGAHFIHVDKKVGLSEDDVKLAINKLNNK